MIVMVMNMSGGYGCDGGALNKNYKCLFLGSYLLVGFWNYSCDLLDVRFCEWLIRIFYFRYDILIEFD